jgi:hypothetical protein
MTRHQTFSASSQEIKVALVHLASDVGFTLARSLKSLSLEKSLRVWDYYGPKKTQTGKSSPFKWTNRSCGWVKGARRTDLLQIDVEVVVRNNSIAELMRR